MFEGMKTPSRFAVPRRTALRVATAVLASSLLVASASAVTAQANDQEATAAPTTAKWVPRKVHFMYSAIPSSNTTYYSCDSLKSRMTEILRQLGARDEVVKTFGCITSGPERFPGIDATFSVLEPVAGADQSAASSKPVDAQWDKVTLTSDDSCALIQQVQRQVLPLFATRNSTPGCAQRFSVEVLRPAKGPATNS